MTTERNERLNLAKFNERLPENVPGAFYMDSTCIDCDMCRATLDANIIVPDVL